MAQTINTPIVQSESVTQNNSSFTNNKNLKVFLALILVAVVSSAITWYVLSFQKEPILITNNGVVVDSSSSDNLPVVNIENKKEAVQLDRIKNGSTVSSPLVLRGSVEAGWMFEGQFSVQIWGNDGKLIVQAPVTELYEGSWMNKDLRPVQFETKVEFVTDQKTGTLVFKNDNPSGLPEGDKSYTVSINFAKKDFQSLLKDICKYLGNNIYPNYTYSVKNLPIISKGGGESGFCLQGAVEEVDEDLKNAFLSLDLFNNPESKTSILIYDEMSLEGGHGGPPFLGFYGKEIYNKNNIRLGVYLIPGMGDLHAKDFTTITLRGETVLTPDAFEDLYVNSTKTLNIENIEVVDQIASKYLDGSSDRIDWDKYNNFSDELIDYMFGDSSKISPKHQKVIDEMISDLNSFEVK